MFNFSSTKAKVLFWLAISLLLGGAVTGIAYQCVKTEADPEIPIQVVVDTTAVLEAVLPVVDTPAVEAVVPADTAVPEVFDYTDPIE